MSFITDNFNTIVTNYKQVQKLKLLVLEVAFQGKLIFNRNEDSAGVLLEKIGEKVHELVNQKKIRKPKKLSKVDKSEIPFKIPRNWIWCRMQEVLDVRDGTHDSPKYQNRGYPLITSKNLKDGDLDFGNVKYISKADYEKIIERSKVDKGDVLYAMIGSIGNPVIVKEQVDIAIKNVALFKNYSQEFIDPEFLRFYLLLCTEDMNSTSSGGVQKFVSLSFLRSYSFPLAPISEQKETVIKVKTLFQEIDQLAEQSGRAEAIREQLRVALLHRLEQAPDRAATTNAWQPLAEQFDLAIRSREDVQALRQTILQLAVKGALVPQDPGDEPAEELLQRIKAEKERLVKAGEIRKVKALPAVREEERPFEVPVGWVWCRLSNLGFFTGGGTPSKNEPAYWDGDILWVTPKDMKSSIIDDSEIKITLTGVENSSAKLIPGDSILIVARSGILKRLLPVSINKTGCTVNQDIKVIIPYQKDLTRYIQLMLKGHESYILKELVKTGTTVQSLKYDEFQNHPFPLPPLPEQRRIVQKVEALLRWCDELEAGLEQLAQAEGKLVKAALRV